MGLYAGILGEIIIISFFVLVIWFQVLRDAVQNRDNSITHRRLIVTAIGLVVNAFAIGAIMAARIYELYKGEWPFIPVISVFFALLGAGNFCFVVAASIGKDSNLLKWFGLTTLAWVTFVIGMNLF